MKRILLIDDDESIFKLLSSQLEDSFEILWAKKAAEGLRMLKTDLPSLVIIDALLPDMNGARLTQEIRMRFSSDQLPIILISAFFKRDRDTRELLKKCEANSFFQKPFDVQKVREEICQLLGINPTLVQPHEFLGDLIGQYTISLQEKIRAMESKILDVIAKRNIPEALAFIQLHAHQIRGSAGSYGLPDISDKAAPLEELAKSCLQKSTRVSQFEHHRLHFLFDKLRQTVHLTCKVYSAKTQSDPARQHVLFIGSAGHRYNEIKTETEKRNMIFHHLQSVPEAIRAIRTEPIDIVIFESEEKSKEDADMIRSLRSFSRSRNLLILGIGNEDSTADRICAAKDGVDLFFNTKVHPSTLFQAAEKLSDVSENVSASILVVDDDQDIHTRLKLLFGGMNRKIESVKDPSTVLMVARKMNPELIILDIEMPGIKGYDLCRAIKTDESLAHIPIVIFSSFNSSEERLRALKTGAMDILSKSLDPEELKLRFQNLLKTCSELAQARKPKKTDSAIPSLKKVENQ